MPNLNANSKYGLCVPIFAHPGASFFRTPAWPALDPKAAIDAAMLAERLGYDSLWVWDHFMPIIGDPTGPNFEGWQILPAWAALTKRIKLGALVSGNTYRHPAVLAAIERALAIGTSFGAPIWAGYIALVNQQLANNGGPPINGALRAKSHPATTPRQLTMLAIPHPTPHAKAPNPLLSNEVNSKTSKRQTTGRGKRYSASAAPPRTSSPGAISPRAARRVCRSCGSGGCCGCRGSSWRS